MLSKARGFFNRSFNTAKPVPILNVLAPVGFMPEEVTLLTSMLSIVAIRSEVDWCLGNVDEAKVFICNAQSSEGQSFIRRYSAIVPVIVYTKTPENCGPLEISKPLRARDLMSALTCVAPASVDAYAQTQQWYQRRA